MGHKSISGKNGTVHYWMTGQGEHCIVFTHGATMDHTLFRFQIEYFAKQYLVITWDVRCHGLSRPFKGFTLQQAAADLLSILDNENIEKAHLVGQSMGGYIIQIVAHDHPERVSSLIAVGSSPMQPSYYSKLDTWLLSITPPLLRLYPYGSLIIAIAKQIATDETSRSYALEILESYSNTEIAKIMDAVYRGVQAYGQDDILPVPLLIIFGEVDRMGKVQTYCRQWAEREKRPLQIIANASHNANMDNPEVFNRVLDEFLQRVEAKATRS